MCRPPALPIVLEDAKSDDPALGLPDLNEYP